jgi:Winged helix-turn-helix DNA-binding
MGTVPAGVNLRAAISERKLRELYVTRELTIAQVARRLGLAATTINRRLRDLRIPTRPRGPMASTSSARDPLVWTADLAYAVGLIATDGNLSKKPGRVAIMSNDIDLLDLVRRRLKLDADIRPHQGGYGTRCYHLAWSDRRFYDWLANIGLTPAKSLTLGPLAIPDDCFADFFRGCIDGDGSIVTYIDRYNTVKSPSYVYTRLYVSIVSASLRFIEWLRASVQRLANAAGHVDVRRSGGRHDVWRLRYAKGESLALLRWIYYAHDVMCLVRKRQIAAPFLAARAPSVPRRPGRPVIV